VSLYYGVNGEPITLEQWGEIMEDVEQKVVKQDRVNGLLVSTVWLGMNHNFGEGEPLIYETMVFPEGSWEEMYMERYTTREQAIAGHEVALEWTKEQK
jgi:hypothetical protein